MWFSHYIVHQDHWTRSAIIVFDRCSVDPISTIMSIIEKLVQLILGNLVLYNDSLWNWHYVCNNDVHVLHPTIGLLNKAIVDDTSLALCIPITRPAATEWSVLLLHDVIYSERVTMHCQWGGKPQNCPTPFGFRHPATCRRTEPGHRQHVQKVGKDRACDSWDMLTDRQTDATDHNTSPCSRWRRNEKKHSKRGAIGKMTLTTNKGHWKWR